jgi:Uma2 family endonuclease
MAEPDRYSVEPDLLDEEPGMTLERWVERPGGRMELVVMPLTPELFLNPEFGDHISNGKRHTDTARQIVGRLEDFFHPVPDVLITMDMKHLFGPGLDQPAPDVSVIRGVPDRDADREIFDVVAEGLRPCLIIEVVSPFSSSRIRRADLEDKVTLYRRVLPCGDKRPVVAVHRLGFSGEYEPVIDWFVLEEHEFGQGMIPAPRLLQ